MHFTGAKMVLCPRDWTRLWARCFYEARTWRQIWDTGMCDQVNSLNIFILLYYRGAHSFIPRRLVNLQDYLTGAEREVRKYVRVLLSSFRTMGRQASMIVESRCASDCRCPYLTCSLEFHGCRVATAPEHLRHSMQQSQGANLHGWSQFWLHF